MHKLLLTLLFLFFAWSAYSNTLINIEQPTEKHLNSQTVVVKGVGEDQQNSFENSLTVAVDRVIGTLITTDTYIANTEVLQEISLDAPSYVTKYKVLEKQFNGNFWETKIEATVAKNKIIDQLVNLDIEILEVKNSDMAHAAFIGEVIKFSDNKQKMLLTFRKALGNLNNVMNVKLERFHYITAEATKDEVPFIIDISVDVDYVAYDQSLKMLESVLINDLKLMPDRNLINIPLLYKKDTGFNMFHWFPEDFNKGNLFFLARKKGSDLCLDLYDLSLLSKDMREFINSAIAEHKIVGSLDNLYLKVAFLDESNKVIYEDYMPLSTNKENTSPASLYYRLKGENTQYDDEFIFSYGDERGFEETLSDLSYTETYCSMMLTARWKCIKDGANNSAIIVAPYTNTKITVYGSAFSNNYVDSIPLRYKGKLPIKNIGKVKKVLVNTVNGEML